MFTQAELTPWLAALHAGEIVAAPAEGVYGYCALAFNPTALEALIALKQRNPEKGFITLISHLSQLEQLCPPLPPECQKAIAEHWHPAAPPTTLILPALAAVPPLLAGGQHTVAVRLPHVAYVQQYIAAANGPLVSTSLNVSGQPPATAAAQIPQGIKSLTLPKALSGQPSRIYHTLTGQWLR